MVGSLAGVYLAGKTHIMKKVYTSENSAVRRLSSMRQHEAQISGEPSCKEGEESMMNFGTVKKILFWWAITIPCASLVSYLTTMILFKTVLN